MTPKSKMKRENNYGKTVTGIASQFFGNAEFCAASARVDGKFFFGRRDRLAIDKAEKRFLTTK